MCSGRTACAGQSQWVHAQLGGMAAGPADGGTGIGHGVERSGAVLAGRAVFDCHGHHAALGKMEAMRGKLAD